MKEIYGYRIHNIDGSEVEQWHGAYPRFKGYYNTDMERVYEMLKTEEFNDALEQAEQLAHEYGFMFDVMHEEDRRKDSWIKKLFKRK